MRDANPRMPIRFAEAVPQRHREKWDRIIGTFMEGDIEQLKSMHRTGARGRIFLHLVRLALQQAGIAFRSEPVFEPVLPDPWYSSFAAKSGIEIRALPFCNPDFLLDDGTWLEATLSENTAYKKLFSHGHQAPRLIVVWLDEDTGRHREVCKDVVFPNASVLPAEEYFPTLAASLDGARLLGQLERLRQVKGIIL
jgi:hypothetical protein